MEELKPKVLFLNSGALPLPAVKGGAVETLLDYLVEMNEKYKKMQIEIISVYDNAAKKVIAYSQFMFSPWKRGKKHPSFHFFEIAVNHSDAPRKSTWLKILSKTTWGNLS